MASDKGSAFRRQPGEASGEPIRLFAEALRTFVNREDRAAEIRGLEPPFDQPDTLGETLGCALIAKNAWGEVPDPEVLARELEPFRASLSGLVQWLENWALDRELRALCEQVPRLAERGGGDGIPWQAPVHLHETFVAAFDPRRRARHGVYATPVELMDFIVGGVSWLLADQHDCAGGFAAPATWERVRVIDPATGSGGFLRRVISQTVGTGPGSRAARLDRLVGFELMPAPAVLGLMSLARGLGTNGLEDVAISGSTLRIRNPLAGLSAEEILTPDDIPVIIGNPPYAGHSANRLPWIQHLLRGRDIARGRDVASYFHCDGEPIAERNAKWLNDDYVKFLRLGQHLVEEQGRGIVAFVLNNGFLGNPTFRGLRDALVRGFDDIYVLDLHGAGKRQERRPGGGVDENVFAIRQGVAVVFLSRHREPECPDRGATIWHADLWGPRDGADGKRAWLSANRLDTISWRKIEPERPFRAFAPALRAGDGITRDGLVPLTEIFPVHSLGIATARDKFTVRFTSAELQRVLQEFLELEPADARVRFGLRADSHDWSIGRARADLLDHGPGAERFLPLLYRPFDQRWTWYSGRSRGFHCRPRDRVTGHMLRGPNLALLTTRSVEIGRGFEHVFASRIPIQLHTVSLKESNYQFPLYEYRVGRGGRSANLSLRFLDLFASRLGLSFQLDEEAGADGGDTFGPEALFAYIYAVLSAPSYRARYATELRQEFPRIPLLDRPSLFVALAGLGQRLLAAHAPITADEPTEPAEVAAGRVVETVTFDDRSNALRIDRGDPIATVPREIWDVHIGGYRICERWLRDRRGRALGAEDLWRFHDIVARLGETVALRREIDAAIDREGGWPLVKG